MKKLIATLLIMSVLFNACQKETSYESGIPATGQLQSEVTGDCFPKNVVGTYEQGVELNGSANYIEVSIDVLTAGTYTIITDTIGGIYFKGTGTLTDTGINVVKLQGYGTPTGSGPISFTIQFDGQQCFVSVTVLPSGSGGPAVFTLNVTGSDCSGAVAAGNYAIGVPLNASNTVPISVNVTSIGTYTITATGGGMTFSATGTFAATGAQTITLIGSGTPATAGNNIIPITVGAVTCNFTVNVAGAAVGTLAGAPGSCAPITVNGIYKAGIALLPTNTVQVQVNVTTPGGYNITTDAVNGISFTGSGNFTTAGVQTVTLLGSGTPTASGNFVFTVTFGSSSCTFSVDVAPEAVIDYFPRTANSNWSYEVDDNELDSVLRYVVTPTHSALGNTYNIFMITDGVNTDSSGYYRKSGTDYLEFIDMGNFWGFDNPQWTEYTFLKDAAANTQWNGGPFTGLVNGQQATVRLSYTVLQKDVSLSYTASTGPMNFNNVIVIQEKYEQLMGSTWQDLTGAFGFTKSYYARGIGWVKYEVFDGTSALAFQLEMRRCTVY